jgi:hypothetical protein
VCIDKSVRDDATHKLHSPHNRKCDESQCIRSVNNRLPSLVLGICNENINNVARCGLLNCLFKVYRKYVLWLCRPRSVVEGCASVLDLYSFSFDINVHTLVSARRLRLCAARNDSFNYYSQNHARKKDTSSLGRTVEAETSDMHRLKGINGARRFIKFLFLD